MTEYQKTYWKSERGKEVHRKYALRNREKIKKIQREWREKNRDKYRAYARSAYRTEKGKLRDKAQHHNRRLREKGLTVQIVQKVYEDNIKRHGTLTCELCLQRISFGDDHLEHFTPLSRGGTNSFDNLGIAHSTCNKRKANKTLSEYYAWL